MAIKHYFINLLAALLFVADFLVMSFFLLEVISQIGDDWIRNRSHLATGAVAVWCIPVLGMIACLITGEFIFVFLYTYISIEMVVLIFRAMLPILARNDWSQALDSYFIWKIIFCAGLYLLARLSCRADVSGYVVIGGESDQPMLSARRDAGLQVDELAQALSGLGMNQTEGQMNLSCEIFTCEGKTTYAIKNLDTGDEIEFESLDDVPEELRKLFRRGM